MSQERSSVPCRNSCQRRGGLVAAVVGTLCVAVLMMPVIARADGKDVRSEALKTYIHGITDEIAHSLIGPEGVPALIELLADPTFPRRDNVVAYLGWLGDEAAADALLSYLRRPGVDLAVPAEDRAILLAPQSLGQIAGRGHRRALAALLDMTAEGANGGLLAVAAARGLRPSALRDDLLEAAMRGLAYSGSPEAQQRLQDLANGRVRPRSVGEGRDLRPSAESALDRMGGVTPAGAGQLASAVVGGDVAATAPAAPASPEDPILFDFDSNHTDVQKSLLTYANHPAVSNKMNNNRLDKILADFSLRQGKADFDEDVACCAGVGRSGSAQSFGSVNDGLDTIDNATEMFTVLNHNSARVKVVRAINYCGAGSGTNIIGCAWISAKGMALVRFGSIGDEGALWGHEYGHNTGLSHNSDSRYIMYECLCGNNFGLTQSECNRFHSPAATTFPVLADMGVCSDVDGDEVQDQIDNCPGVANNDQTDSDGDGVGDACEGGSVCGNGVIDPGEECDGSDFGGATCDSEGYDGGSLSCTDDCEIDTSLCTLCGNGVREGDEQCDGLDLGGATCEDVGCDSGTPMCTFSCQLDYTFCSSCTVCDGDGICEEGEECDTCNDCADDPSCSPPGCDGDGVCEIGENCRNCDDCAGRLSGHRKRRFCCGDGKAQRAERDGSICDGNF